MFTLMMATDTDAFTDWPAEVSRILAMVADRVADGEDGGTVLDCNGNKVGTFSRL